MKLWKQLLAATLVLNLSTSSAFTPSCLKLPSKNLVRNAPYLGQQSAVSQKSPRPSIHDLRASLESSVGWIGRPGSSMQVPEPRMAEMRMSQLGRINIDGAEIQYDYLPGDGPVVFYLPALNQTRHGAKANAVKTWCRRNGRSFLVADYFGTGKSDGEYKDATITRWAKDAAALIDWLKKEHEHDGVIIVGAGVGGWVMLHTAQWRKDSIVGLVGVAADPDFTETLVWPALEDSVKAEIENKGLAVITWAGKPYTVTKALFDDGRKMQVLNKGPNSIPITCPVRLIQGLGDEEIPPERALELSDCLLSRDVVITYVKYGKHALEDYEDDFRRIYFAVEDIERQVVRQNWLRNMNRPV